jgi:hypothetical protein
MNQRYWIPWRPRHRQRETGRSALPPKSALPYAALLRMRRKLRECTGRDHTFGRTRSSQRKSRSRATGLRPSAHASREELSERPDRVVVPTADFKVRRSSTRFAPTPQCANVARPLFAPSEVWASRSAFFRNQLRLRSLLPARQVRKVGAPGRDCFGLVFLPTFTVTDSCHASSIQTGTRWVAYARCELATLVKIITT